MSDEMECPYCAADVTPHQDEGSDYAEDVAHEIECDACGKNFVYLVAISFNYSPQKADCLNGAEHAFGPWRAGHDPRKGDKCDVRYCDDCRFYETRPREETRPGEADG